MFIPLADPTIQKVRINLVNSVMRNVKLFGRDEGGLYDTTGSWMVSP